jgi:hypothetical protein
MPNRVLRGVDCSVLQEMPFRFSQFGVGFFFVIVRFTRGIVKFAIVKPKLTVNLGLVTSLSSHKQNNIHSSFREAQCRGTPIEAPK